MGWSVKSWLASLRGNKGRDIMAPLYRAVIAAARNPFWYREGGVPDTLDGRFDMIAAILSAVLLRLERDGEARANEATMLAELFIDDMDGQLRELGVGDVVVGKHVGKMMGALGGRMASYRGGLRDPAALRPALERNLYRGQPPGEEALAKVETRLRDFRDDLDAIDSDALVGGALPELR